MNQILLFTATINDQTTTGITIKAMDILTGAPTVYLDDFFVQYLRKNFQIRIGQIILPENIGLDFIGLG